MKISKKNTKKNIFITLLNLLFPNKATKNIKRNKYFAAFLAMFGGIVGLHQFYLQKPFIGILYILFFVFSPIMGFIDAFIFITMTDEEWDQKYNKKFLNNKKKRSSKRRIPPFLSIN